MTERLTLDTNLARDVLEPHRPGHATMLELLELAEQGEVELIVTRRIEADIPNNPLAARLAELPTLGIGSALAPMRFDVDRFDEAVFGDETFIDTCSAIVGSGWRPSTGDLPDWRDQDHLHTHLLTRRDVFLTRDRALREFCLELMVRGFPIRAMTAEEYLAARSA